MGKTKKEPKVKRFDPSKMTVDYTKTSISFGFRPFNIKSAAQEQREKQALASEGSAPPGISREGTQTRDTAKKRKQDASTGPEEDSDSSEEEYAPVYYTRHRFNRRKRLQPEHPPEAPKTFLKLRVPTHGKKKIESDGEFFETLLDSCNKWLSPPNAVKKGMRDLDKRDVVWKEGDEHKVVIIAAGTVAKKVAMKAEELVRARANTTVLQTITLGPTEYDVEGNIKTEIMTKVAASIKKHDACKPKFLFLVTRNAENVMYGMRTGVTEAMEKEVNSIIDTEENSDMTDIIGWRMKDIKKGTVSQHIKKGTIHGIVFCGAPRIPKPEPPILPHVIRYTSPATTINEYPPFREVSRRLADILDTFDESVQEGLAIEDDYVVHLKYIITVPTELLRAIGENFKQYVCDCRVISRTPPVDANAMGLMLADLMCSREFSQSPLLDPIELGEQEFPLVLIFSDGNPTQDQPAEEDRYAKIITDCLLTLRRKQYLRGFTLLSAKFVNSKAEGLYITNSDVFRDMKDYNSHVGMWEDYNDGENMVGYQGLDGCEYIVHVLTLFR